MSGISGIYHYANEEPISQPTLRRMTKALAHRGPDDEGLYLDHRIGLGHRRLSVIDLAGGHQPIFNEDGALAIVFDGQIYNYLDLAQHVVDHGYRLLTKSDPETVLHLYEEYGEACVTMLRGSFAFALWDGRRHSLLLARDQIGQKPIYYADLDGRLIFGSELKSVVASPEVPRVIDEESLGDYFSCGYIPAPKTVFRDIRKLQAGHYLVVTRRGLRVREYWDFDFADTEEHGEEVWCASILESLCKAVGSRLIGEAPLGALL
jgi:asparagine synthase (glutamine-hydrolysing)